jgi:hypothetical protein
MARTKVVLDLIDPDRSKYANILRRACRRASWYKRRRPQPHGALFDEKQNVDGVQR